MRELKSSLASIKDELPRMQQRVMQQTTDRMEATEERLLLTFQLAQATARIEGLEDRLRENVSGETP